MISKNMKFRFKRFQIMNDWTYKYFVFSLYLEIVVFVQQE